MIIRPMNENDLSKVMEIENESFLATWNEEQFLYELNSNPFAHLFVCEHNDEIIGFYDMWITFEEASLNQIAVSSKFRNRGLGKIMMGDMLKRLANTEVEVINLEVRTHNEYAIKLYESMGFKTILTKAHYYTNGDDAYYMSKEMKENE